MAVQLAQLGPLNGASGNPVGTAAAPVNGGFCGYCLRNGSGSKAIVRVWNGVSSGRGQNPSTWTGLLATVELEATGTGGASVDIGYDEDQRINFATGLYVELVSGTMPEGYLRYQTT